MNGVVPVDLHGVIDIATLPLRANFSEMPTPTPSTWTFWPSTVTTGLPGFAETGGSVPLRLDDGCDVAAPAVDAAGVEPPHAASVSTADMTRHTNAGIRTFVTPRSDT